MSKKDYNIIWASMEEDRPYTSSELGVAAASLRAMAQRGLIEIIKGKPNKYKKLVSVYPKILSILAGNKTDYFTLYPEKDSVGMLCSLKNNTILDCWGEPYDISLITYMTIKTQGYDLI